MARDFLYITSITLLGILVTGLTVGLIVLLVLAFRKPAIIIPLPGNVGLPLVYPYIGRQVNPGASSANQCFNQVNLPGNEKTYTNKLLTCKTDTDCTQCTIGDVKCLPATDRIRGDQEKLYNNSAANYCLPVLSTCMNPTKDCDFSDFKTCRSDLDCTFCNDKIGTDSSMTCVQLQPNDVVQVLDQSCMAKNNMSICLPQRKFCDPDHGIPTWVDQDGEQKWICDCRYPDIYAGDACNIMIACAQDRVRKETQPQQMLLVNAGKSFLGVPWNASMGITPGIKVCNEDPTKTCSETSSSCTCVDSTVCQCDGVDAITGSTFKTNPTDPNTCVIDKCSTYLPLGGRTGPDGACICSGQGRTLWEYDSTGTPLYRGSCEDRKLQNVTLLGQPTSCVSKNIAVNSDPKSTGLVPDPVKNTCILDPCTGLMQDIVIPESSTAGHGHWNPATKQCDCLSDPAKYYDLNIIKYNAQFTLPDEQMSNNVLGHMCFNACNAQTNALCKTTAGNTCHFNPDKPFAYDCTCNVDAGYKPGPGSQSCLSCNGKDVGTPFATCQEANCCGTTYSCYIGSTLMYSCHDGIDCAPIDPC